MTSPIFPISPKCSESSADMHLQITAAVLLTLSIVSMIARLVLRLRARRGVYLDDYLYLVGFICLSAETIRFYQECDDFMLASAIHSHPYWASQVSPDWIKHQTETSFTDFIASFALMWSAIFAIKCSFLAFFKLLIERVTGIRMYYWFVVVVTMASWLVVMLTPLILCHDSGLSFSFLPI